MLIRSQNKEILANMEGPIAIEILGDGKGHSIMYWKDGYVLGFYSSKKKAIKVLDMIQEAYTKTGVAKSIVSEMAKVLGRASAGIDDELAKSTGEALVKLMCFQMPEDSEVEV